MKIQMVDLKGQYETIKQEIDVALLNAVSEAEYINGAEVKAFQKELEHYCHLRRFCKIRYSCRNRLSLREGTKSRQTVAF